MPSNQPLVQPVGAITAEYPTILTHARAVRFQQEAVHTGAGVLSSSDPPAARGNGISAAQAAGQPRTLLQPGSRTLRGCAVCGGCDGGVCRGSAGCQGVVASSGGAGQAGLRWRSRCLSACQDAPSPEREAVQQGHRPPGEVEQQCSRRGSHPRHAAGACTSIA